MKKWAKTFKFLPRWQNFDKSGHAGWERIGEKEVIGILDKMEGGEWIGKRERESLNKWAKDRERVLVNERKRGRELQRVLFA